MKSRTSFFNPTVFVKDITRFAPAWAFYLVAVGLVMVSTMVDSLNWSSCYVEIAWDLARTLEAMAVVNFVYALVCSQLLFGDLFNTRLCNALHAFSLRREGWFGSHCVAGMAFSLVPNFIMSLVFLLFLGDMWFISFFWLLANALQFLFFFAVGAFSAVSTGNRFGMALVYGLINLIAVLVIWLVTTFYEPLFYGVPLSLDKIAMLSPVVWMAGYELELFSFEFVSAEDKIIAMNGSRYNEYLYHGLSDGWWYLLAVTVVGVAFLVGALLLYRRRKLEKAGDLMAFSFFRLPFSVLMTLGVAAVFQLVDEELIGTDTYVFLIVGLMVGLFGSEMLLQRTVRVFKKKTFLKLIAIGGIFGLSILLTALDPLGVFRWTPEPDRVASVTISNDYRYEPDAIHVSEENREWTITDPELIGEVVALHGQILEEDRVDTKYWYRYESVKPVYLRYTLKSGRVVNRRYYVEAGTEAWDDLARFYESPPFLLGSPLWEQMADAVYRAEVLKQNVIQPVAVDAGELLETLKADCEEADVRLDQEPVCRVWFYFEGYYIPGGIEKIEIYPYCTQTLQWLQQHGLTVEGTTPASAK